MNTKINNKKKANRNKKNMRRKGRLRKIGIKQINSKRRQPNIITGNRMAAASAKGFKKRFAVIRQNGNSVRVTGRDLIYSIPDDLTAPIQDTNVITVIPANPAYWKGTRISALASGYQNYRPLLFKLTYVPMCAVTQPGNVIGGTIWDDGIDNDNIQQSLRTSNGGFLTQCYVPHTTQIRPKTNLQFNLYRLGGEFNTTSNPFIFIAMAIGCKDSNSQRVVPGYFYVTWSFELKNPVGNINTYNNTGLVLYRDITPAMNNTIINIDPNSDVPFGAYIDMEESQEDGYVTLYNGTPVTIEDNSPVWAFTSVTKTSTATPSKIPIVYQGVTTSTIRLEFGQYLGYIISETDEYHIYLAPTISTIENWRISNSQSQSIMLISDTTQNFGTRTQPTDIRVDIYRGDTEWEIGEYKTFEHYIAPKSLYTTIITTKIKKDKQLNTTKIRLNNLKVLKPTTLTSLQNKEPIQNNNNTNTNNENYGNDDILENTRSKSTRAKHKQQ